MNIRFDNARHFPDDPVWQKHCADMKKRSERDPITGLTLDQIRDINSGEWLGPLPITSNAKWDGRKS